MSYAQAVTYIDELPPMVQMTSRGSRTNPYFEEVVKEHPSIQSKIRQTDTNFFGKYEETMPPAAPYPPPTPMAPSDRAVPVPDYPLKMSPPGAVEQSYLDGNMVPIASAQHLPVAHHIQTQYNRPMAPRRYQSTYPIVENLTEEECVARYTAKCKEVEHWQKKCEMMYWGIIAVLLIVILLMARRLFWK